jgi:hypothetical protein
MASLLCNEHALAKFFITSGQRKFRGKLDFYFLPLHRKTSLTIFSWIFATEHRNETNAGFTHSRDGRPGMLSDLSLGKRIFFILL